MTTETPVRDRKRHELSRRDVLRTGGLLAGGFVLGGTAVSERALAAHGKTGGSMLLLSEPLLEVPFTAEESFTFEFPASCFASESAIEGFQELVLTYSNDVGALATIRTDKKHFAADGETAYVFHSSQVCRDSASPTGATVWKVSFGPA